MLSPEYLDNLPDSVVQLFQDVEDDILRDMARRIKKMDGLTDTAAYQAWRLEQTRLMRQDIVTRLSKMSGKTQAEIRKILQEAGTEALLSDDAIYTAAGKVVGLINDNPALLNLLNAGYQQTAGTFSNITATTANTATQQFERALDRAWLQVSSGAFDYQTILRRTVDALAKEGIKAILYPSGHSDTLEVATRRALLTGVNQTAAKLQLARMDEMECDLVEVTAHSGARPSHAAWQGKIYSRSGKSSKYPPFSVTGYGSGPGLCGWNCRHNFYPYWEGLSRPNYTQEDLDRMERKEFTYNGQEMTRYEASQYQRYLERNIRAYKRQYLAEEAAGVDTTRTSVKLAQWRARQKDFLDKTGLDEDNIRHRVSGFGHSQASKAAWEAKKASSNTLPASFAKTSGISSKFASGMSETLKHSSHSEVQAVYAKYQSKISCIDNKHRAGAYFSCIDGGIHFNEQADSLGSSYQTPYEVVFHEFGHNIDWLIGGKDRFTYASNRVYNGDRLGDIIKSDYKAFKKSMGAKSNADLLAALKQENMSLLECGNISDILEFCVNKSYPLGVGHGVSYHKRPGATEREFFAEVLDSAAANEASFKQLQRIFPNAVNFVFEILKGEL